MSQLSRKNVPLTAEEATAQGYRRISNRHQIVSRIDRPDWLEYMGKQMHRPLNDFYTRSGKSIKAGWADHYRRVYSRDQIVLPSNQYEKVPGSNWDETGYVPKPGEAPCSSTSSPSPVSPSPISLPGSPR